MVKIRVLVIIGFFSFMSCNSEKSGVFFTKQEYENGLNQAVNVDVLERIKNDSTITEDEIIFSFYYITNKRSKIDSLMDYMEANESNQQLIELNQINDIWELNGRTYPIRIELDSINKWETKMWKIGYMFDCKLDGWETIYPE